MPLPNESILPDRLRSAFGECRPHLVAAAAFSAVANILALAPSIYMMQVYDRVVPTGGLVTLAALSAVGLFVLAVMSMFDWLRGRLLVRAGLQLDAALAGPTLRQMLSRPGPGGAARAEAMRDLDTLRQALSSTVAVALFDAPWTPIYIAVAFLLHPALGTLALGASLVILALAVSNERRARHTLGAIGGSAGAAYARQVQIARHAGEVRALGLTTALAHRQLADRAEVNRLQTEASFSGGGHSALMKFLRLALQSGALALGAVLVTRGSVTGGAVFASSLLLSRALQPIEQIVASWKNIVGARAAYDRLRDLGLQPPPRARTRLPAPTGAIDVERLTVAAPGSDRVALAEASFGIASGTVVGVVGPSGSGKSTLLAALAGALPPARGHVRLDGASTADLDPEELARHIGYLPQNFVLFPGTVKENISRFRGLLDDDEPDGVDIDAEAVAAAVAVGAHEMILRLPDGYDTAIGMGGLGLSAGQAQRIALARALFGRPPLLLLDEPTAHLDGPAQHAFTKLLSAARQAGTTVLFATHSADMLASVDKLLVLRDGRVERLGPVAETVPAMRPVAHTPIGKTTIKVSR